jgi:hypothetical protein
VNLEQPRRSFVYIWGAGLVRGLALRLRWLVRAGATRWHPDCNGRSPWARHSRSIRFRPALALALVGVVAAPCVARAESVPPEAPPATVDARAFVGFGSGIAVDAWLPGHSLRVDHDAATTIPSELDWGGLAVIVPVVRSARSFFGLRAGDTLEYTATKDGWISGSRFAHAPDAGVVGHLESAGGSTLEGQVGVEAVLRKEEVLCCDDAPLPTSSFGVRLALRGELALSDAWALVAQAGLRTADHLLEINFLPTFAAGVRVRF